MATMTPDTRIAHSGETRTAQSQHDTTRKQPKPKIDIKEVVTATFKDFSQDDCSGMAAESAYHILFSIFPLLIFSASMSAIFDRIYKLGLFGKVTDQLYARLPAEAATTLKGPLTDVLGNQSGALLSFGILTALWSGSAVMSTFIKSLNRAYDVEETRKFWQRKLLEIGLTLFLGVVVVAAFVAIVFGGMIGHLIAVRIGATEIFTFVWNLARWVLVLVFISLALAVLYWIGPNVKQQFKWISPGAIVATIVWVLAILGFGLYVTKFGSYNKTYGTLGGVIVLLLVFYLSSLIVMLGAELNSELGKRYDDKVIQDIADNPDKDKGETIYAEKAPGKKPEERETDLKGAEVRSGNAYDNTSATTRNDPKKTGKDDPDTINAAVQDDDDATSPSAQARQRAKIAHYGTGKREDTPEKPDANAPYRMTASGTPLTQGPPPKAKNLVGVALMAVGAVALAAKNMGKRG